MFLPSNLDWTLLYSRMIISRNSALVTDEGNNKSYSPPYFFIISKNVFLRWKTLPYCCHDWRSKRFWRCTKRAKISNLFLQSVSDECRRSRIAKFIVAIGSKALPLPFVLFVQGAFSDGFVCKTKQGLGRQGRHLVIIYCNVNLSNVIIC